MSTYMRTICIHHNSIRLSSYAAWSKEPADVIVTSIQPKLSFPVIDLLDSKSDDEVAKVNERKMTEQEQDEKHTMPSQDKEDPV